MSSRGIKAYTQFICFHFYSVTSPEIIMPTHSLISRLKNPFSFRPIWRQVEIGVGRKGVLFPFVRENAFFVHLFRNNGTMRIGKFVSYSAKVLNLFFPLHLMGKVSSIFEQGQVQ